MDCINDWNNSERYLLYESEDKCIDYPFYIM